MTPVSGSPVTQCCGRRGQGNTAYGCGSGNTVGLENVFDLGRVGDLKSATSSASDCGDPGQGG